MSQSGVRWLGFLVTTIAIGFVGWGLYSSGLFVIDTWMDARVIGTVILASILFTISLFFVCAAWYLLVISISEVYISFSFGFYVYSTSQIYKYIPSNIMHHVGRYYMLRQHGVGHSALAWGSLAEAALIVVASIMVALVFGAPLIQTALLRLAHENLAVLFVILAAAVFACGGAIFVLQRRREKLREFVRPFLRRQVFVAGLQAFLLHLAARLVSGLALSWLTSRLLEGTQPSTPDVIAIWAAAWVIGYLTPGASAGLGVREAVIIAAFIGAGATLDGATLVALAFRVATTLGDLIFTGLGYTVHRISGLTAQQHDPGKRCK